MGVNPRWPREHIDPRPDHRVEIKQTAGTRTV